MAFAVLTGCAARQERAGLEEMPADEIVMRIRVRDVEDTGWVPCWDDDCMSSSVWSRYRARVREVIRGEWHSPDLTFARLEHAPYIQAVTHDCYVVLESSSPHFRSTVGEAWIATELYSRWLGDGWAIRQLRGQSPSRSARP